MSPTADIVIIGGGANGTSTAFHLARMGAKNVRLLERRHLAAGATGKSGRPRAHALHQRARVAPRHREPQDLPRVLGDRGRRLRLRDTGLPADRAAGLRGGPAPQPGPSTATRRRHSRGLARRRPRALPRVPRGRHRRRRLGAGLRLRRPERHRVRLRRRRAAPGRHHRERLPRHPHPDRGRPRHRRRDRGRARGGPGGRAGAGRVGPAAPRSARPRLWSPALPHPGLALPLAAHAHPQAPGGDRRGPEGVDPPGGRQPEPDRRRAGRGLRRRPGQAARGRGRGLRGALPRAARATACRSSPTPRCAAAGPA